MMRTKRRNILLFLLLAGLLAVSFVIKFKGHLLVSDLFEKGDMAALNRMANTTGDHSLEFYQGRIEEAVMGPASMILSGTAFLFFGIFFLRTAGAWRFGAAVFVYFLITKFEILFFPPYGDGVSGQFVEAVWLLRNNFDYAGLAQQPGFISGGPKVYLFSMYPTYQALLMKFIPDTRYFLMINHLLTFAFGSVIVSLFHRVLLKVMSSTSAFLTAFLFLSLPLFHSQVEALNMEVPVLLFAMLSLYFLSEKKMSRACVMSMLAGLVKVYALITGLCVFAAGMFLFLWGEKDTRFRFKTLFWSLMAVLASFGFYYAEHYFFSDQWQIDKVGLWKGWVYVKDLKTFHLYLASSAFFVATCLIGLFSKSKESLRAFLNRNYVSFMFFIFAGSWFFLFVHSGSMIPRYLLIMAPALVYGLVYVWERISIILDYALKIVLGRVRFVVKGFTEEGIHRRMAGAGFNLVLVGLIFYALLSSYGRQYQPSDLHTHATLERSLEYRQDLKLHMALARTLETRYADYTISAPLTMAQALAFPELGYVRMKLSVMIFDYPCVYEGITRFRGLKQINAPTLWLGFKTPIPPVLQNVVGPYPVAPEDKVIERVTVGYRTVELFLGGVAVEKMRMVLDRILQQTAGKK